MYNISYYKACSLNAHWSIWIFQRLIVLEGEQRLRDYVQSYQSADISLVNLTSAVDISFLH